jgi:uncharacterized protein YndB with AHSA1/START domain
VVESFETRQSYYLPASPARVFRSLTVPAELRRWFLADAELQPRKGGQFRFSWGGGYWMTSEVSRFQRNRALGLVWLDARPDGSHVRTDVLLSLRKQGSGTLLTLRHRGFTSPRHYAGCATRWAYYLTNLKSVLGHGVDLRSEGDG